MPELPECEAARRLVERNCVGRTIEKVTVTGQFDDIIMDNLAPGDIGQMLKGRRLDAVKRKGKNIWWELSGIGPSILFHFGMTGAFLILGINDHVEYQNFKHRSEDWPPRYTKLRVVFEGGVEAAFAVPRRIGRVRLRQSVLNEPPISKLAPDPLTSLPSLPDFQASVLTREKAIKAVLLDQEMLISGVGNWVCDEILYHSRIAPSAVAASLDDNQIKRLWEATSSVIGAACEVEADSGKFPKSWLFHRRWGIKRGG
eukprot:jgi/Bigna1/30233/gw1.12.192.1